MTSKHLVYLLGGYPGGRMWDLAAELSSRREPSEYLRARPGGLTRRTSVVAVGSPEYVVPDGRRLGTRACHPGDGAERCVAARVPRALPVRTALCAQLALAPARHCLAVLGQAGDPDTLPIVSAARCPIVSGMPGLRSGFE